MKTKLSCLVLLLALAGCATAPPKDVKPSVVVEYKYVAAPIPEELLVIPDQVAPIDLSTATQKTVADWLARSEGRSKDMETKLKLLKQKQDEQKAKQAESK